MKQIFFAGIALFFASSCPAQALIDKLINAQETERVESILSSDKMEGRKVFTPAIDRAADFIAGEFKKAGLHLLNGSSSYLQDFTITRSTFISAKAVLDRTVIETRNIVTYTSKPDLYVTPDSGYIKTYIRPGDNFREKAMHIIQADSNFIVLVDTSLAKDFHRMPAVRRNVTSSPRSAVFILTQIDPVKYEINVKHEISKPKLNNVVGMIPGKSRKDEYVIFSAHYDHLGIGTPNEQKDSIFNGANDDASGTTAVILLARYFAQLNNNERTLIFVAFTGEESGGYGSQYFSRQLDPSKVAAMFNIEMIGTESKWGTNSAYITGFEKTDFGKILQKNLEGSVFHFNPDPYTDQHLFYRSDNATLARQGVPAHTLSTSKMDNEKFYHTRGDEIQTLDMKNMAEIIKSIAISASTIISGKDSPSRVDTTQLK